MNCASSSYRTHEHETKNKKAYVTAGARTGSVMETSVIGGDKTVLTEALQLAYTEFRHGGAGGEETVRKPFPLQ